MPEIGRPFPAPSLPVPALAALPAQPLQELQPIAPPPPPAPVIPVRENIPGNTYTAGNCTWFAKSRRPDIPNNLGNADTWYYRAAAQGFAVGSTPQVGAVAAAVGYMHVAIVTSVSGNQVGIIEMNYEGLGIVSSRMAPTSEFQYIY